MGKAKKQHYVPRFYLKHFAIPETRTSKTPQAYIFGKGEDDPKVVSIRDIAAQRYLYSPENEERSRSWETEERLSDLESIMAPIWPALANDYLDLYENESIRKAISLFLATLLLRHPSQIDATKHAHTHVVRMFDKLPKDQNGNPLVSHIINDGKEIEFDPSEFEKYKSASKNSFHHDFVKSIHKDAIYTAVLLLEKRWSVILSDDPVFITTDKPVVIENQKCKPFGLKTKDTFVIFPLSPTRLLLMDDKHGEPRGQYYPLTDEGPGPYNLMLWRGAQNFMISARNTDLVCFEIIKWADQQEEKSAHPAF
jgi:hypothetical protein